MKQIILIIAAELLSFASCYAIIPDTVYIRRPEQLGLVYRDLNVVTKDNYKIKTWFFPAQYKDTTEHENTSDGAGITLNKVMRESKRPTIIICDGDAGNMSYFPLHLALGWTSMGFNVVAFDWRGFGESSSFPMNHNYMCYTEMLEDYRAVVEEVYRQKDVKKNAIVVMGWSTGSYLSMITAYNSKKVSAFIGRSLPTDFKDCIPLVMKKKGKTLDQLLIPKDFPVSQMPVCIASKFNKPIFLIVGENDTRTPVWMSQKVLSLLPPKTHHELMIVKNAAHGGGDDPMLIAFDEFLTRTAVFLEQNL